MIIKNVLSQLESAAGPVVKAWQKNEHGKVLVLGFKKGMILKEHQTALPAKLLIIDGRVSYREGITSVTINKFEDMDIPVNVPHSVEALEDSICLLIQG